MAVSAPEGATVICHLPSATCHLSSATWLLGEEGLVAQDAVEGGAGDAELAGGAELVSAVEVEDVLDVMADDGVEGEAVGADDGLGLGLGFESRGEGEVVGADDAVCGFEEGGFKDGGEFADVSLPVVLEEAGEGAGSEGDGALLVACADAIEEGLGKGGDVFAAKAQGWYGEADGGEAEGEVGEQESLAGHLAERGLGGGDEDGAARGAVLEAFEDAEEHALPWRGEEVDAVEVGETGEGGGVSVGGEPLAGIAALEGGGGEGRAAEEVVGKGVLADAVFAFNGGDLDVGCDHFSLHEELAPGGADADDLHGLGGVEFDQHEARGGRGRLELSGALHGSQCAKPPRPHEST